MSPLLRWLAAPGAAEIFPLVCSPWHRDLATRVARLTAGLGLCPSPVFEDVWRSYATLASADARHAFFRTLTAVIDVQGQSVSATDRLYLASQVPTLLVWGARDRLIPVQHAEAAHARMPGSRLVVYDDVGHFPQCEAPERLIDTLLDFVDTTAPTQLAEADWVHALRARAASA